MFYGDSICSLKYKGCWVDRQQESIPRVFPFPRVLPYALSLPSHSGETDRIIQLLSEPASVFHVTPIYWLNSPYISQHHTVPLRILSIPVNAHAVSRVSPLGRWRHSLSLASLSLLSFLTWITLLVSSLFGLLPLYFVLHLFLL